MKKPKAKLFFWPLLSDEDYDTAETQAIECGYTTKKRVAVGRVNCWLAQ